MEGCRPECCYGSTAVVVAPNFTESPRLWGFVLYLNLQLHPTTDNGCDLPVSYSQRHPQYHQLLLYRRYLTDNIVIHRTEHTPLCGSGRCTVTTVVPLYVTEACT